MSQTDTPVRVHATLSPVFQFVKKRNNTPVPFDADKITLAIYRMLTKRGYAISTGMLLSNDLDCYVATGLGAKCVSQPPGSAFTEETRTLALREMEASDMVIEASYHTNGPYLQNQDLIRRAAKMGKPVFSFRTVSGRNEIDGIIAVADSSELFTAMEVHCL